MLVEEEDDLSVNVKWISFCSPGVIINVNAELFHKLYSLIHEPERYNLFLGGSAQEGCKLKEEMCSTILLIDTQCFSNAHQLV